MSFTFALCLFLIYLAVFAWEFGKTYIRQQKPIDPRIHSLSPTSMSAPVRRNPHRRCRHTLEPPIQVPVWGSLFDDIIDNLGSQRAIALRTELRRLLRLQENHAHHLRIIRIIAELQEIIRDHAQPQEFNYQLLIPVPRFRGQLQSQGPGYAIGNLIL
jgi:hypothetical protein